MIKLIEPKEDTIEFDIHGCLSRLTQAGKITDAVRTSLLTKFEKMDGDEEWPMEFRLELKKLFELDADLLDARKQELFVQKNKMTAEIDQLEGGLQSTETEDWQIVDGVARKQAELYNWSRNAMDPFVTRVAELERAEDMQAHSRLLQDTKKNQGDVDYGMAA